MNRHRGSCPLTTNFIHSSLSNDFSGIPSFFIKLASLNIEKQITTSSIYSYMTRISFQSSIFNFRMKERKRKNWHCDKTNEDIHIVLELPLWYQSFDRSKGTNDGSKEILTSDYSTVKEYVSEEATPMSEDKQAFLSSGVHCRIREWYIFRGCNKNSHWRCDSKVQFNWTSK